MSASLFGSDIWKPALDKYSEATGLTVELFGADGQVVLGSTQATALVALFREYRFEPGLFAQVAHRCLSQTGPRPAVILSESHGLTVVGTSLILHGEIVGAAVAGYALAGFFHVGSAQRWSKSIGVPFDKLWEIARRQAPVPERRLRLHGELLQVLGDALLRENYHTRQYEDAVAQLRAAAAAKDEFLAVLSHELRTPLAAIVGWAGVLRTSERPDEVRRAAETIERNAMLQSRMVDDLLDVNRISHGKLELDLHTLELKPSIHAALDACAHAIEQKRVNLEFVDGGGPLYIHGDVGRVQQIFRNIITNAVKFTAPGGNIRVVLSRDADTAHVAISDTGEGIAPEFLPFVFDIFRQQEEGTRRQHQGLGIGLALVKRLTELHRGSVNIESEGRGLGTVVSLRFPVAAEIPALRHEPSTEARPSAATFAGLSVLVIEDSDDARESLRLLLKLLGAKVSAARDGREALEMIGHAVPDLVLCDLRMPRMDGYEFIRELRRASPSDDLPVIAISGLAGAEDRQRTREAGFGAHVMKPFDTKTIAAAVDAVLTQRAERRLAAGQVERGTTRLSGP